MEIKLSFVTLIYCRTLFQRGDKVTLCNGEYLCYNCVLKNTFPEKKESSPKKSGETLTIKKDNDTNELDAMTTSLISTIVSDSSEVESISPEKRYTLDKAKNGSRRPDVKDSYPTSLTKDDSHSTKF